MVEHPIQTLKATKESPRFRRGKIKSDVFEGTQDELFSTYLRYRLLCEFGKLVTSETRIDKVLDVLLDKLVELTGAERSLILLFDNHGKTAFQVGRNLKQEDIAAPTFELSWSIINKVRETNETVFLKNALEDPEFKDAKSVLRLKILSVICLPLVHIYQLFGVLYADNRTVQGIFQQHIYEMMLQLMDLIAGPLHATLHRKELENNIAHLEEQIRSREKYQSIIGHSPQIQKVLQFIDQVANTTATVLIEGESGTGKELFARALHENSRRRDMPFVSLNCGALPETLLESELFGHAKGSFTGATADKKGWFETANGGTIFFDEISEMSPALQVKLLRILQSGEFSPVGSSEIKTCSVRVIAATNKHLEDLVNEGSFRPDLFYRLNILFHKLASLRERREDIPLLAVHFLRQYGQELGKNNLTLSSAVQDALTNYHFPGNIRELENAIQHAAVMVKDQEIEIEHLPEVFHSRKPTLYKLQGSFTEAKRQIVDRFEREYIEEALKEAHGVVAQAARNSGMDAKNFYQKMEKLGIKATDFKQLS